MYIIADEANRSTVSLWARSDLVAEGSHVSQVGILAQHIFKKPQKKLGSSCLLRTVLHGRRRQSEVRCGLQGHPRGEVHPRGDLRVEGCIWGLELGWQTPTLLPPTSTWQRFLSSLGPSGKTSREPMQTSTFPPQGSDPHVRQPRPMLMLAAHLQK